MFSRLLTSRVAAVAAAACVMVATAVPAVAAEPERGSAEWAAVVLGHGVTTQEQLDSCRGDQLLPDPPTGAGRLGGPALQCPPSVITSSDVMEALGVALGDWSVWGQALMVADTSRSRVARGGDGSSALLSSDLGDALLGSS